MSYNVEGLQRIKVICVRNKTVSYESHIPKCGLTFITKKEKKKSHRRTAVAQLVAVVDEEVKSTLCPDTSYLENCKSRDALSFIFLWLTSENEQNGDGVFLTFTAAIAGIGALTAAVVGWVAPCCSSVNWDWKVTVHFCLCFLFFVYRKASNSQKCTCIYSIF